MSHVKEVHNISNVEFVPVDINATDIEKDRFLICEDEGLKRQKRANDINVYSKVFKNKNHTSMKRSKVVNTHDDSQSIEIEISNDTKKQEIKLDLDVSEQQQETAKRKHSIESTNVSISFLKLRIFWYKKCILIFNVKGCFWHKNFYMA